MIRLCGCAKCSQERSHEQRHECKIWLGFLAMFFVFFRRGKEVDKLIVIGELFNSKDRVFPVHRLA